MSEAKRSSFESNYSRIRGYFKDPEIRNHIIKAYNRTMKLSKDVESPDVDPTFGPCLDPRGAKRVDKDKYDVAI